MNMGVGIPGGTREETDLASVGVTVQELRVLGWVGGVVGTTKRKAG